MTGIIFNKSNQNANLSTKFVKSKDVKKLKNKDMSAAGFKGKKATFFIRNHILYIGIEGIKDANDWRELGYKTIQYLKKLSSKTVALDLPDASNEFVEGLVLGDYEFNQYKSKIDEPKLKQIVINCSKKVTNKLKKSIAKAKAQCITRDLVNTTPEDMYSDTILEYVSQLFDDTKVKVSWHEEEDLDELDMNGHLAVNRASRHEAMTIKLTYKPKKKPKETIVLVGKGLTYDSGGLSIKPGNHMTTMKADKAGAMTLIGFMDYISKFGSNNKIVCYLAIAENMIDGSAYKPDDVLTMKNGKTVHVKNTDAEGRLVLFDNLCLAQEENKKIDKIYSLATLTGAAVYQFGDEAAALVGFNGKLKKEVIKKGKKSDEIFMNAEFHKYMMDGVKDSLADLSNTGTPNMGCQKAGLFLTNSIKKKNIKKYVHWDIAGPAFVDKSFGTNPAGGTGFGVRTLIELFGN